MSGLLTKLSQPFISSVLGGVNTLAQTFTGSKLERDEQRSEEYISGQNAYAAEFTNQVHKTWFNAFVDGLNRLVRPVIVGHVFAYLWCAVYDLNQFMAVNIALDLVPEWMRWTILTIVGFYFVSRELAKSREMKMGIDPKSFASAKAQIASLRDETESISGNSPTSRVANGAQTSISPSTYKKQMADTSKPLSNAAIEEWNRQRAGG